MIKILSPLKSFAFFGAFVVPLFINGQNKLIKGYFSLKGCPKNAKWPYLCVKIKIYGYSQNIGPPRKFCLCDVVHFWCLFKKWMDQANKRPFQPYRVSKKTKWPCFERKLRYNDMIKILSTLKRFAFLMRFLFLKIDKPSKLKDILAIQGVQKCKMAFFWCENL